MPRPLTATLLAATLSLASLALAAPHATPTQDAPPPPQHHDMNMQPKNLQVLPKDISAPDLMARMHEYSQSLGVHCGFCHAQDAATHRPDFASDAKPEKATARTMIAMTMELNEKYMSQIKDPDATPEDKKVTCATCHRGNSMPVPFTPPAEGAEHHDMPKPQ
ncbi:c-type cytochrome [Silvibacterium dinghuense]|nr:c-type cytochrome [Silvibacterium dinghuense]GGH07870.1 hypothetical protein GCM10011586_25180 [Silvibacterium dinghuense]